MKITFLIGNGFDMALSSKYQIEKTDYKSIYNWNKHWEFDKYEQGDNMLVNSIYNNQSDLWSDFEDGLVSYFSNIEDVKGLINFFKDKDQICGYIYEYLKNFFERKLLQNKFCDFCIDEFASSVLDFTDRMNFSDKNKIINFLLDNKGSNDPIYIDFINFNGTNTLELLLSKLSSMDLSLKIGTEFIKADLGKVKYLHSRLGGKTENYNEYAFGTTAINDISPRLQIPTSLFNLLVKTNYNFGDWIKDTDLFITHGLSFGNSDEYYWGKIVSFFRCGNKKI